MFLNTLLFYQFEIESSSENSLSYCLMPISYCLMPISLILLVLNLTKTLSGMEIHSFFKSKKSSDVEWLLLWRWYLTQFKCSDVFSLKLRDKHLLQMILLPLCDFIEISSPRCLFLASVFDDNL
jgi:hypothetical protein